MTSRKMNETKYLNLLHDVLTKGERRTNRTGIATLSLFGPQLRFDLGEDRFPLVTTKRVHWKSVVHELLWILSGSSRTDYLEQHGVSIWSEWSRASYRPELCYEDGELGPVYGVQWRRWFSWDPNDLSKPIIIDQIAQIVDKLRHHRDDRRILLSSWNVGEIDKMKLPPCHYAAQFHVDNDLGLRCLMNIRSWDLFLGGPFNIASYALLTHMLAHVSGLRPRELIIQAGDAHIYENHVEQVQEQVMREIRDPPTVQLSYNAREIDDFRYDHIMLRDYNPHPPIKGDVAV